MKKLGFLLSVFVLSLVLTGCGKSNKLVCTMKNEQSGIGEMKTTATTYFNNKGNANKVDISIDYTATSESTAKTVYNTMKSTYKDIKLDGKKVIIKQSVEPEENDEDITRKEAKKQFEQQGYTCK